MSQVHRDVDSRSFERLFRLNICSFYQEVKIEEVLIIDQYVDVLLSR